MKEKITKEKWLQYADAVGDYNPIHRSEEKAREAGLEAAIAPGMYVLSFLQKLGEIRDVDAMFLRPVKHEDEIEISEKRISVDEKPVIRLNLVFGDPDGESIRIPKLNCIYSTNIAKANMNEFLESIGMRTDELGRLPEMYLMALSSPALLDYGREMGKTGIHVSQSVRMHFPYNLEKLEIGICGNETLKPKLEAFDLFWLQSGKIIASGKARVKPLEL